MIGHYLLTTLRAWKRQRAFAVIHLVGLVLGLACSLLIFAWVQDELAYDRGVPEADRVVRVVRYASDHGQVFNTANNLGQVSTRIQELYPAVEDVAHVTNVPAVLKTESGIFGIDNGFAWADPGLFTVLGYGLDRGDPASALSSPNTVVLGAPLARRLFGELDPVGRTVRVDDARDLTVTGILRAPKGPSHMRVEAAGSRSTFEPFENPWARENQGWNYLRLVPGVSAAELESQINANLNKVVTWFVPDDTQLRYGLQPVRDIRLHSDGIAGAGDIGDLRHVWLFSAIGLLILVMACVNFTNLATARATRRAREVGMRKAMGATRTQLAAQFLGESVAMSLVALAGALIVIQAVLGQFNALAGKEMEVVLFDRRALVVPFVLFTLVAGVLAGIYPALLLSRQAPSQVLRGYRDRGGHSGLRRILVVFQFSISAALILATVAIRAQMEFVRTGDLGFEERDLVVLRTAGLDTEPDLLRRALEAIPSVTAVSFASGIPAEAAMQSAGEINGHEVVFHRYLVDDGYLDAAGLTLLAGRGYRPGQAQDREVSVIVNETVVRLNGWEDPIGRQVAHGVNDDGTSRFATVVGVVKDFHTGSMRDPIMPAYLDGRASMDRFKRGMLIRLAPGGSPGAIDDIARTWARFVPARPASIYHADDVVKGLYDSEDRLARALLLFTALAMVIAGLGLFGLAAFSAERRTKEIGIRKALGATMTQIVTLVGGEFARLVAVSVVIGVPVAVWGVSRWLEGFAYRIRLGPEHIGVTVVAVLVITLAAVGAQAIQAARLDPVDTLRSES